ncbi:MAG: phosphopantetheine-binding protein [Trichlorobacter sp.]|jgi:acyl carrier protein
MSTTEYAEIFAEVKVILERFVDVSEKIDEETELINDLDLDSLRVMEIVQEVEDTFDISFPLNELSSIRTVKDFVLQVQQEIKA